MVPHLPVRIETNVKQLLKILLQHNMDAQASDLNYLELTFFPKLCTHVRNAHCS